LHRRSELRLYQNNPSADRWLDTGYKLDLIVESSVVVELKAVARLDTNVHVAQLLTYLKVTDLKWGLLINFCAPLLKDGIRRLIRIPRYSSR
jgi:GxxExxY protein